MDKLIQLAIQLQHDEEQNAKNLDILQQQAHDTRIATQLEAMVNKEHQTAARIGQLISQMTAMGPHPNKFAESLVSNYNDDGTVTSATVNPDTHHNP